MKKSLKTIYGGFKMNINELYEFIPVGKANAVSKIKLCEHFDVDERTIRKHIAELRNTDNGDNYIIISSSHYKGYYKTDNLEEIEQFEREVLNRGKHTFYPLVKVRRVKERIGANGRVHS